MKVKYLVRSLRQPNLFLVANVQLGSRIVPFGFKACAQILYEATEFASKDEAVTACEEAAKYNNISLYYPTILEVVVKD